MKLLITGGHLTPALGLIDHIIENHPTDEVVFLGREYSQDKNKQPSKERSEVEKRSVHFIPYSTGKFVDKNPLAIISAIIRFTKGFFHACSVMIYEKPDIFISFGSYLAVPVALAAWLFRVPIITHEQTRTLGSANRFISMFAAVVAVSYKQTLSLVTSKKGVFTGNILRKQLLQRKPNRPAWIPFQPEKPVLYITGGSQGSEVINTMIAKALPVILKDWFIVHQCGAAHEKRSYKQELEAAREQLQPQLRLSYVIREWVSEPELAWIYNNSTGLVSRAGANTTQEIALFKIPAILIPLPFSNHNEQQLNAEWLQETGGAIVINQKDLTVESIFDNLEVLKNRHKAFSRKLEELQIPLDADSKVYELALAQLR